MSTTLPYGHRDTVKDMPGGWPCRGTYARGFYSKPDHAMTYHPRQIAWMQANKPTLYTGNLHLDIAHLPQELRSL